MLQLILHHLAIYLQFRWLLDQVGNSMENYTFSIRAKMRCIKDRVGTLLFFMRWILAHGESALLYAEELSVYD